ncbi:MAG: L-2-hydroxyglutarate oxidase [Schleiferiaceae bacterium]|nr:L-2-hydroxyglutarate oxidase [Schleiferiaceae bacterium]
MQKETYDLAVVGGGVVGLATAYQYQKEHPEHRVGIFEKETSLSQHQTGRNSGVIHSGIYYKPGSFKARNCYRGRHLLVDFAREHGVDHEVCGKIILATEPAEVPMLEKIFERGQANGTEGIQMIGPEQIQEIEPHARGVKAIRVPVTGIIDYRQLCEKLAAAVQQINPQSKIHLGTEVLESVAEDGQDGLLTAQGFFPARQMVFCGGLQADRLAKSDGAKLDAEIVGFRGDYYELTEAARHKVKHLIYPVPDPEFPFLGVHFTRMTDGSVECGPNAVFSFKREGYSKTAFSWRDTLQALSYPGTWRLFLQHPAKGLEEYQRAFSKRLFLKALRKLIPDLQLEDIRPTRSGVRAQALRANGALVDDFEIIRHGNTVHVLNAPSPAATAALAIGEEILTKLKES